MKHLLVRAALVLIAAGCTMATGKGPHTAPNAKPARPNVNTYPGFAVLELFTSEGCSSCPPADRLLGELSDEYPGKIFAMGFHVDYWDRLGWKDRFSSADYTARQQRYVQLLNVKSAYTPQVVVNGTRETVGSDRNSLEPLIQKALQTATVLSLEAKAVPKGNDRWSVSYQARLVSADGHPAQNLPDYQLNVALLQKNAQSSVSAGENKGNVLGHVNVVRYFESREIAQSGSGEFNFRVPKDLPRDQARLFLFAQDANNGQILSAVEVGLQ